MMCLLLLLLNLILFSCSGKIKDVDKDFYNLAFSESRMLNGFSWEFVPIDDIPSWKINRRMDGEAGKSVFSLEEGRSLEGKCLPLRVVMAQQFPLFRSFDSAALQVKTKGEHLEEAWLKVYSLDAQERCVRRDSVWIKREGWSTYHLSIPMQGVQYLWVAFSVRGKPCEVQPGARFLCKDMDIRLDGNSINDESGAKAPPPPELDRSQIRLLSFDADSLIGHVPLFADSPRIIGLGETMHGSLSLGKVKNQIIRWLVKNRGCKLIMVEVSGILALKWDLYTQGYPISLDEIMEDQAGSVIVREEMTGLLRFLREYNRTAFRKVHVVGIDRTPELGKMIPMFDYLYAMYRRQPDNCLYRLIKDHYQPDSVYSVLTSSETELVGLMGRFEYAWFRKLYGLKVSEQRFPGVLKYGAMNKRDSIIWLHAECALQAAGLLKGECAVVTAHWLHLNSRNSVGSLEPSLGHYLAERYGRDYRSVALLGGVGNICALRLEQMLIDSACVLSPPAEFLLENRAMETGIPYFYYPAELLPRVPVWLRCIPLAYERRKDEPCNVPERTDGFIFVRNCESAALPLRHRKIDAYYADKVFNRRLQRMLERGNKMGIDFGK